MNLEQEHTEKVNKENPNQVDCCSSIEIPGKFTVELKYHQKVNLKKYQENYKKIKWK